jgi:hypothetical protein
MKGDVGGLPRLCLIGKHVMLGKCLFMHGKDESQEFVLASSSGKYRRGIVTLAAEGLVAPVAFLKLAPTAFG